MKAPVNAALLIGFIAALGSGCEARADAAPDTIGVMAYSYHPATDRRVTNSTPGITASWRKDWGAVDAALFRNSQGHPGFYIGASREWTLTDRLFVGAGAGAVWGYRDEKVTVSDRPSGERIGCYGVANLCAYQAWGPPKWSLAAQLKAWYRVAGPVSLAATYSPAKLFGGVDAWSFWLIYERGL